MSMQVCANPSCRKLFEGHHCTQKYCSAECRLTNGLAGPEHICRGCGKRFMWNAPNQFYCGDPCVKPTIDTSLPESWIPLRDVLAILAAQPGESLQTIGARFAISRQRVDYIFKRLAINPPEYYRGLRRLREKAINLTIYHPGMRTCVICKNYLPIDDFTRHKGLPCGRDYKCKNCNRDLANAYYARKKAEAE